MPLTGLSTSSSTPQPQYLSVVPSDRQLVEKHSGAVGPSQELKFVTSIGGSTGNAPDLAIAPPNYFSSTYICPMTRGTEANSRIGRTTTLHLWSVRVWLEANLYHVGTYGGSSFPLSTAMYRVVFGIDHQPDSTTAQVDPADLFSYPPGLLAGHGFYQLPFNPVNEQRFTILYDNYGKCDGTNGLMLDTHPTTPVAAMLALGKTLEFKTVLNVKQEYGDSDIQSNSERPFVFVWLPQATLHQSTGTLLSTQSAQICHNFRFTD